MKNKFLSALLLFIGMAMVVTAAPIGQEFDTKEQTLSRMLGNLQVDAYKHTNPNGATETLIRIENEPALAGRVNSPASSEGLTDYAIFTTIVEAWKMQNNPELFERD